MIHTCTPGERKSITDTVTDKLNKYLKQAAQRCKLETNYFQTDDEANSTIPDTSETFHPQEVKGIQPNKEVSRITPESYEEDTSNICEDNTAQSDNGLSTILEEEDPSHQDTVTFNHELNQTENKHFDMAVDTICDGP